MAADYLDSHASARNVKRWDALLLHNKVRQFGFGLLICDLFGVEEVVPARESVPSPEKVDEVMSHLQRVKPVA